MAAGNRLGMSGRQAARRAALWILCSVVLVACSLKLNPYTLDAKTVSLIPDSGSIAFDEITYDTRLDRVLVPAAATGKLALVNPGSREVQIFEGLSGDQAGKTGGSRLSSAVVARGYIFLIDQGAMTLIMVDPASRVVLGSAPLSAPSEFVRYVPPTNELWVTQPEKEQIEVFSIPTADPFTPTHVMSIPIPKGPEDLLIDRVHGLAYTNQPGIGMTAVLQVQTHGMIGQWGNGCSQASGLALDEDRGYLFVGCSEGKVVLMDANNEGRQLASQSYGGGVDFIAYNPRLQHLYLPSGASAILAVFGIRQGDPASSTSTPQESPTPGEGTGLSLVRLGTADTALNASCVAADQADGIWVCDPARGSILYIQDTFPAGGVGQ